MEGWWRDKECVHHNKTLFKYKVHTACPWTTTGLPLTCAHLPTNVRIFLCQYVLGEWRGLEFVLVKGEALN